MTAYDFDLFVIGGGSGGVRAARMSAQFGAKVGVAEEYRYGGTCVIRGCVPKKLFVYASRFGDAMEDAEGFGWTVNGRKFDWPTLVANKDREIDRLSKIYIQILDKNGVTHYDTRAEIVDAHSVRLVTDDKVVTAETILIATGATPFVPDIPGAELGITSNEAFHLPELPASITVVGGGYIAVEFAGIFNGLGVETTLLYRGPQILRGFDDDLRDGLAEELTRRGINVHVNGMPAEISKTSDGYGVRLEDDAFFETGLVMFATGRIPNTQGLGAEKAGVQMNGKGAIIVDQFSRSSVDTIYAVGDVTDRVNLTPVAIHEGAAFAETLFNSNPTPVDHDFIPTAVFSEPEIGTIGLTESEARDKFAQIDLYKSRFRPMKHTLSGREEYMLVKLIVDGGTDKVLGCHIMGPDAAEIVQILAVAMRMGLTKKALDATMALHPSAAEELVTMHEKWLPPQGGAGEQ
ncbi:glutathione amide reductase [bacterium MnTg02]|nr:glutathione amide reductase [bacterium MnTg02]